MFSTRFTEAFGIEPPIVQGGMQWVSTAPLVVAVSNGGGRGLITALTRPTPGAQAEKISRAKSLGAEQAMRERLAAVAGEVV